MDGNHSALSGCGALGTSGHRGGVVRLFLDSNHPCDVVCRSANRTWSRTHSRRGLEIYRRSLLAGLACSFILSRFASLSGAPGASGAAERIAIISIFFASFYLGATVVLYRGFAPLRRMASLLREMVPAVNT